ncbi:hypothetical protein FKW77_002333 [Venturia effusa]|uniref:Uncharacterized protein n=1 Tax=Venturia effusa TaxID=50376 RepID=A0A517LL05_9PEZI|nr:hypothetical protein FKW77_002333 [Venturia effusa]
MKRKYEEAASKPAGCPTRKIPIELWNAIFTHLISHEHNLSFFADRSAYLREARQPPDDIDHNRALSQARILRATCKTFAENHVLCSTLFHEIKLYTTMPSFENLRDLSKHTHLRTFVRRINFVYSKLDERYCDATTYRRSLKSAWEQTLPRNRKKFPYSSRQAAEGLKAYQKAYGEQEFVLESIEQGAAQCCLSQFPKFDLVHLSIADDLATSDYLDGHAKWLKKHHPDVDLIRAMSGRFDDDDAKNRFATIVFNALMRANKKPVELSSERFVYCGATFQLNSILDPRVLQELQTIDLPNQCFPIRSDWDAVFKPIVSICTRMERLYIHFCGYGLPVVLDDEFLKMVRFPKLKDFHIGFGIFSGDVFAAFVEAHPSLEEISHGWFEEMDNRNWTPYWRAMGEHPKLSKFTLLHGPPDLEIITGKRESLELEVALYDYVHKKGPWTEELARVCLGEWPDKSERS